MEDKAMKGNTRRQRLIVALEEAAPSFGFELVDVEVVGPVDARIVRVFLDREGGCGVEDLAQANSWVAPIVEEDDPEAGPYTLEVSSPGIDRPLRTLAHFARAIGEDARLATEPIDGRGAWTGTIIDVTDDAILLAVDGETRVIPYRALKKARLKGRIDFNSGKDSGKGHPQEGTDDVI
jgi:ribosome maturation factor RimP